MYSLLCKAVNSVSFDDPNDDDLFVFSGMDLLIAHYDEIDLDWREVAERSMLDARRGLVIAQVVALEDPVDEFILNLVDGPDEASLVTQLEHQTIGPRLVLLKKELGDADLLDERASGILEDLQDVVRRRNELAHRTIHARPVGGYPVLPITGDLDVEWIIGSRRSREWKRITMCILREDFYEAGAIPALRGWHVPVSYTGPFQDSGERWSESWEMPVDHGRPCQGQLSTLARDDRQLPGPTRSRTRRSGS